jgi:hypothetical protein
MSESKATGKVVAKANSRTTSPTGARKSARTSTPAPLKSVSYIMPVLTKRLIWRLP